MLPTPVTIRTPAMQRFSPRPFLRARAASFARRSILWFESCVFLSRLLRLLRQVVKTLGVVEQDIFFRVERQILARPENGARLGPAHVPVRVIRGIHQSLRADLADHKANHFLFRLAAV